MFIFNLGRKGGLPLYAKYIIENLNFDSWLLFQSKFSDVKVDTGNIKNVPTYRSNTEFVLFSLPVLFYIFFKLLIGSFSGQSKVLYFPYVHYWTPAIFQFGKILRFKNVLTVHDGVLHLGDGMPFESKVLEKSIRSSDKIIVLSEHVKNQVLNNYDIPTSVDIYVSSLGTMAQDRTYEFEKKTVANTERFLFFGRVSKYKGVEILLEAFKNSDVLKNKALTIVGKSNYEVDYGNSFKLMPNLRVIDEFIPEDHISTYINEHDILVLPYIEATQSGVLTYACESNTLVVMTRVGGLTEQLPPGSFFGCEPRADSLKDTLEQVVLNPEKTCKVHQNFTRYCEELDSHNKIIVKNIENFIR